MQCAHAQSPRIESESDESELEESRGPDAGAIEPYMYEPLASESEETDESDQDAEERRDNTDR